VTKLFYAENRFPEFLVQIDAGGKAADNSLPLNKSIRPYLYISYMISNIFLAVFPPFSPVSDPWLGSITNAIISPNLELLNQIKSRKYSCRSRTLL
jgi:hypothetical protein